MYHIEPEIITSIEIILMEGPRIRIIKGMKRGAGIEAIISITGSKNLLTFLSTATKIPKKIIGIIIATDISILRAEYPVAKSKLTNSEV
jgi:hypothetical protein